MADWPSIPQVAPNVITNYELFGFRMEHIAVNGSNNTAAWGAANEAIYTPFRLPFAVRAIELWWLNGTTIAATNADIGIYRDDGVKVITSGSTALSGANTIQKVNITDTDLPPGRYYFAYALSSNTATPQVMTFAAAVEARILGICMQSSALALPDPITPATMTRVNVPMVGMTIGRMLN